MEKNGSSIDKVSFPENSCNVILVTLQNPENSCNETEMVKFT